MKTSTSIRFAAAGVIGLASMAQAQSVCAINCFQSVITEHPPLDCTEENMYLCFCKRSNLQNWFAECIWDECDNQADAAISFGVDLCADYGITITPPTKPEEQPSTTQSEPEPTTQAEEEPEETQAEEEPESTQAEPQPTTQAEEQPESTQAEETQAAEETKATTAAAPAETTAATEPAAPKPTTIVSKPSHADNTTVVSPTNPPTVVNMGASNAASGILAAAGLAVAAFQLL